jgi:hypothetical protein
MASKVQRKEYGQKMKQYQMRGRLYWRSSHPQWRSWSNDDICQIKYGTARVHFNSLEALDNYITGNDIPF